MPKIPVRKRHKHRKRKSVPQSNKKQPSGDKVVTVDAVKPRPLEGIADLVSVPSTSAKVQEEAPSEDGQLHSPDVGLTSEVSISVELHGQQGSTEFLVQTNARGYSDSQIDTAGSLFDVSVSEVGNTSRTSPVQVSVPQGATSENTSSVSQPYYNICELLKDVQTNLSTMLSPNWLSVLETDGLNIMQLSRGKERAVQRRIFVSISGAVEISVHCRPLPMADEIIMKSQPAVHLSLETKSKFTDRIVDLVQEVKKLDICCGADHIEYKPLWTFDSKTIIDLNPYQESRYVETLRSKMCRLLVATRSWRCQDCNKLCDQLKRKVTSVNKEQFCPSTPYGHLTETQKILKIQTLHKSIRNKRRQFDRLQERIRFLIDKDGVALGPELDTFLGDILKGADLNPVLSLFIQQQYKAASVKRSTSMRWHPTMVRLALYLKISSTACDDTQDRGIQLPCKRTLLDFSQTLSSEVGCRKDILVRLHEKVKGLSEPYMSYHTLMFDEMQISKNLVYKKSTGEIVGYMSLSSVEEEIQHLQDFLNGEASSDTTSLANKMLTFFVKGAASDVSDIVASFPTPNLTKEQLYRKTWEVITSLERAGIKIIVVVCDGCSTNRAFIDLHIPHTSGRVIFDTTNLCSPDRVLYFMLDPPYLLKLIRNCFANSGVDSKKPRNLTKNGKPIEWKTIVRLFLEFKNKSLCNGNKLNSRNVFINNTSCMKLDYAVQVMSRTVAADIEKLQWQDTEETVDFIRRVNDVFDCLYGAHPDMETKINDTRLSPYMDLNDFRFDELLGFLNYLDEWKAEVHNRSDVPPVQKAKMLLSYQTLDAVEMTIKAFIGTTKFLLKEGTPSINARVFCQDHLETYFSKLQSTCGGGTHSVLDRCGRTHSANHIPKNLVFVAKEIPEVHINTLDETLPKRRVLRRGRGNAKLNAGLISHGPVRKSETE